MQYISRKKESSLAAPVFKETKITGVWIIQV